MVTVYPTVPPGVVVAVLAVFVMVRAGVSTGTVIWQGALVVPGGHDDPAAAELAAGFRSLSPVSGLLAVTE